MKWNGMNDPVDAIHYVADGFSFFIASTRYPLTIPNKSFVGINFSLRVPDRMRTVNEY